MIAARASRQTALKRLAGGLSFLCLVLFLLALEQRHTVAAVQAVLDAAGRLTDRAPDGEAGDLVAPAPTDAILAGEFAPADSATRAAAGAVTFVAAELRFENGETLRTRPLRIARAAEAFASGQTYAARLAAPAEAQIELREVIEPSASRLCAGAPAAAVALLHRGPRVEMMLFRAAPESAASSSDLCGVWSFTAR